MKIPFLSSILKNKNSSDEKLMTEKIPFDKSTQIAVIKCSICNGEQVAGFKDLTTGHFTEVCVIHSIKELESFKGAYGIDEIRKEY